MTTTIITTTTDGPIPASRADAVRRHGLIAPNFLVRRIVVAAIALAVAVATVTMTMAVLAGFGGVPAVASEASPAPSALSAYVARPGDTIWSIAAAHRGEIDHGRYVEALIEIKGGTAIDAGQAVRLP
jgi:hypothetical protein